MKFKTGVILGFGIGYVLGAKAGRGRYEQIQDLWTRIASNPQVQRLTEMGIEAADAKTASARTSLSESLHAASDTIRAKLDT